MTKKQLRQLYTSKRQQLTDTEYAALNRQLLRQFQQLDLSNIHYLHLFLPAAGKNEPNTLLIRDWLKSAYPHITLVYPKTSFSDYSLQNYADDGQLKLETNSFGIPEPVTGTSVGDQLLDIIIIPLLAFDRRGYRVGYGKGFYDRFIARCRPNVQLIGLSLFEPVSEIDDLHEFDVPLQYCVTPETIWKFG